MVTYCQFDSLKQTLGILKIPTEIFFQYDAFRNVFAKLQLFCLVFNGLNDKNNHFPIQILSWEGSINSSK